MKGNTIVTDVKTVADERSRAIWFTQSSNGRLWASRDALSGGLATLEGQDELPAVVVYEGKVWAFFRRPEDMKLRYYAFDENGLKKHDGVIDVVPGCGPAAVVYKGEIRLFYQREDSNVRPWPYHFRRITEDDRGQPKIGPETLFVNLETAWGRGQAEAVVFGEDLYVLFRNWASVVCYRLNAKTQKVEGAPSPNSNSTPGKVSACVYQGVLVVASVDSGLARPLLEEYDGDRWYPALNRKGLAHWDEIGAPGVVVYRGLLYIFYVVRHEVERNGQQSDDYQVHYRTYDGNAFSVEKEIQHTGDVNPQQASNNVRPFVFNGNLYLCYQDVHRKNQ